MEIPLSAPDITEAEISSVSEVLRSPRLSLGAKLIEFERDFADYIGTKHAVAVNSGTSALHLAVRALNLSEGDEVITTPFSFIASANAILYERATPVFVDINSETLNIDAAKIEAAITPRTRAILPVHVFGRAAPMLEILEIARRYNLKIIEDAAEAIGAKIADKKVGAFGDAGIFAFYPNKQITTGEGGMLVTDDERIANSARRLRNQGRDQSAEWFEHTEIGYNYRLSEVNCALGVEQLKRIETILSDRAAVARKYNDRLANNANLILPEIETANARISWFVYVVHLRENFDREQRDFVVRAMNQSKIGCGRYFAPIHLQPVYREKFGYKPGDFPVAEAVADRVVALPFFNRIADAQIERVCATFEHLLEQVKK